MTKANTTKQRKTEVRNPDKQTPTKQTPKYLTGGKWLPVVYAALFAIFAYYMLLVKNADYLYAAQEHSLFVYDKSFFDMLMVKPSGLMAYLGCFCTQFFHEPIVGVCILIAIWMITYFLTIKAFKLNGWWSVLALLPIGALLCSETIIGYWLYYNKNQGYWFAPSIALMINMLAIWLHRCFKDFNKWAELGMIIIWCFVGYWATGWLGLVATLIMGLTGITKTPKSRLLPLLIAIICIICVPLLAYQHYSQMRIDDAWWVGMPIFETENVDATRPWYPFVALIVILLVLGTLSFTKKDILLKSKETFLMIGLQLVCLASIVWCELKSDFDNYNYHAEFRVYRAIDENRWQDALEEVSALPNDPTREIIMLRDVALNRLGKTGDYLFKYNNMSIPPYVYDSLDVHMAQTNSPLVYLNYARLNFATRWCIENSVEHGFSNDSYKILTRCALVAGEYELARKYISILKKTLYYKEWAERYEPMLENPKLIEESPELSFILEYYRKEYPQITANASQIPWQLDDDMSAMLPVMQTDIMLTHGEKTLIIDAKYYAHSTQIQYDKHTLHSGNMYQIFTYVKNKEVELADKPHEVSGMLLYAKTDEDIYPENEYRMSGNRIEVRTLNLDGDFDSIKAQLDGIAERYFGIAAA